MKKILRFLPWLGIALGFVILLYFPITEYIDSKERQALLDQLDTVVEEQTPEIIQEYLTQAQNYNLRLAGQPLTIDEPLWPYNQQLAIDGENAPMASLRIPKIGLIMPVYHGDDSAVLSTGAGQVEYTSLPVGGETSHCVLSGHSGLQSMRAFDDIQKLVPGDVIGVQTLGTWYCYEMTGYEIVEPDETDKLEIIPNEDILTLVTCVPYGINSQRYLLHAKRCEVPADFLEQKADVKAVVTSIRIWPVLVGLLILLLLVLWLWYNNRRQKKQRQNDIQSQKH